MRPATLVAFVCSAQVLAQIGAYTWPSLLPTFVDEWQLSNSQAGAITGAFYAAYVLAVPILVTLTDRIDPKRIYLLGVALTVVAHASFALFAEGFWSAAALRTLAGIGWAGTYMTGLKLLADRVDGPLMSRAVAWHAASIGIAGALSFVIAETIASHFGWQSAFVVAAGCALAGWLLVLRVVPRQTTSTPPSDASTTFDFRPVLANRPAMAYAVAYCVHTWEMGAIRGWVVVFLAWVASQHGSAGEHWLSPAAAATAMALVGTWASVSGNELSIRLGRKNLIAVAMLGAGLLALVIGPLGSLSYTLAVALVLLYGALIWLDSSSLTAGAAGSADPARRGATLAVHSMLGYFGGLMGPLVIGAILDAAGGRSTLGWSLAFGHIALVLAVGFWFHRRLGPEALSDDR